MYAWTKAAREGRLDIGLGSHTPQTAMTLAEFLEEASAFFAASRRK